MFVTTDNRVTEIDVLGNKLGEWFAANRPEGPGEGIGIPTLTMHHEVDELSNGNILVMGTELREYEDWWTSEQDPAAPRNDEKVMGDHIIEFTREGQVVWEWKALDHLDPYRIGYETFTPYWIRRGFESARDWSHGNGFFHDERDDSLLTKPLPPALTWTRAVEYRIDEEKRTVKQLWQSEGYREDALMTFAMGEADVMPNSGNVLVFYGTAGVVTDRSLKWSDVLGARGNRDPNRGTRIREFTRTYPPQLVWDVDLFDTTRRSGVRWSIYGGARIPRLGRME